MGNYGHGGWLWGGCGCGSRRRSWAIWGGAGGAVVVMLGGAWAQPAGEPALKGPEVREQRVPGVEQPFGESTEPRRRAAVSLRAFVRALGALREESTPAAARLTPEQEEQIAAIQAEYRDQMLAALRERAQGMDDEAWARRRERARQRGEDRPGEGRGAGEPARGVDMRPARDGPAGRGMEMAAAYETRIWALLTEPQRAIVEERMAEHRRELERRQGEEMMQRRLRAGREAPPRPDAADGLPGAGWPFGADAAPAERERMVRIMRRLRALDPAEREQILRRLDEHLARRLGEREGGEPEGEGAGQPPRRPRPAEEPPPRRPR